MIKTTKKHFEFFKSECLRFQRKWGITSWTLLFSWGKIPGRLAQATLNYTSGMVTVEFALEWDHRPLTKQYLTMLAKEEMIHVVMGRFSCLASERHVGEDELDAAEHEAVRILEKIIPD